MQASGIISRVFSALSSKNAEVGGYKRPNKLLVAAEVEAFEEVLYL